MPCIQWKAVTPDHKIGAMLCPLPMTVCPPLGIDGNVDESGSFPVLCPCEFSRLVATAMYLCKPNRIYLLHRAANCSVFHMNDGSMFPDDIDLFFFSVSRPRPDRSPTRTELAQQARTRGLVYTPRPSPALRLPDPFDSGISLVPYLDPQCTRLAEHRRRKRDPHQTRPARAPRFCAPRTGILPRALSLARAQ